MRPKAAAWWAAFLSSKIITISLVGLWPTARSARFLVRFLVGLRHRFARSARFLVGLRPRFARSARFLVGLRHRFASALFLVGLADRDQIPWQQAPAFASD